MIDTPDQIDGIMIGAQSGRLDIEKEKIGQRRRTYKKIFRDGFDAWRKDAGEEKGAKLEKIDAASLIPGNDAVLDGLTK